MNTRLVSSVALFLMALPVFSAPTLVAQWDRFMGLSADNPIPPDRGSSLYANTWRFVLEDAVVNADGSLTTTAGKPPLINFNGNSHNVAGWQSGSFTVLMMIRPESFNTASPKAIWSILVDAALTNDQMGIVCSSFDGSTLGIRGIWGNTIWTGTNPQQNLTPLDGSSFFLRSSATTLGLFTSLDQQTAFGWGGLKATTLSTYGFAFGNFAGDTTGGNAFTIDRLAIYHTESTETDVLFDETPIVSRSAAVPAGAVTAWGDLQWEDATPWVNATVAAPVDATLTLSGDATLQLSETLLANRFTLSGEGALVVNYVFTADQLAQLTPANAIVRVVPFNCPFVLDGSISVDYSVTAPAGYVTEIDMVNGCPRFSVSYQAGFYSRALSTGSADWFEASAWSMNGAAASFPTDGAAATATAHVDVVPESSLTAASAIAAEAIEFAGEGDFSFVAESTVTTPLLSVTNVAGAVELALPLAGVSTLYTTSETTLIATDSGDRALGTAIPHALGTFVKAGSGVLTVPSTFSPSHVRVEAGTLKMSPNATLTNHITLSNDAVFDMDGNAARYFNEGALIEGNGTLKVSGSSYLFAVQYNASLIAEGSRPNLELALSAGNTHAIVLGPVYKTIPFQIGNLKGIGAVRGDTGNDNGQRTMSARLTEDCTFSGAFIATGTRTVNLTVESADPENIKTLTLAGNSDTSTLTIRDTGSVNVAGIWTGPMVLEQGGFLLTSGGLPAFTANGGTIRQRLSGGSTNALTFNALGGTGLRIAFSASDEGLRSSVVNFNQATSTPVSVTVEDFALLPRTASYPLLSSADRLTVISAPMSRWEILEAPREGGGYIYTLTPISGTVISLY